MPHNSLTALKFPRRQCVSQRKKGARRSGAALVEFALVAPLLLLVMLGMIEVGRGIMVTEMLGHAARIGARTGAISTGTTSSVTSAVNDLMTGASLTGHTLQVKVNGVVSDLSTAKAGDEITVAVSIPYANVTWVGNPRFLSGKSLKGQCTMRRE